MPCLSLRTCSWAVVVAALAAAGCGKTGKAPGGVAAPGPMADGGAPGDDDPGMLDPQTCQEPQPGPSPLLRLTNVQVNNTLRDLFRDVPIVGELEALQETSYDEPGVDPSTFEVESFHQVIHDFARLLSEDPLSMRALAGCDPASQGAKACREQFLNGFLSRVYRRPANDEDLSEMTQVFATGEELGGDFASGLRAVVEVALQGPDFRYLIEFGEGEVTDDVVPLSPYETAARLSYLLTSSAPDSELLLAAERGGLDETSIEAQARRLLGTRPNRNTVRAFHAAAWRFNRLDYADDGEAPFTAELAQLALQETGRFIEEVTFDGAGTFRALLTQPSSWMNETLATFYGVPGVTGDEFRRVELEPTRRAGILTQAAFLRSTSTLMRTSPVMRGLTVLNRILCVEMPPPPPEVPVLPPEPVPEAATTRQRMEIATRDPSCQSCHGDIDPIGFAFEHYDSRGLWRDTENGLPIDASGELYKTDARGKFQDAIELIQRIGESEDARACYVGHWMTAAYGRREAPEDACSRQDLEQAFTDSDGNVVELLVALAKSDNLRYRLQSELAP